MWSIFVRQQPYKLGFLPWLEACKGERGREKTWQQGAVVRFERGKEGRGQKEEEEEVDDG